MHTGGGKDDHKSTGQTESIRKHSDTIEETKPKEKRGHAQSTIIPID